MKFAIILFTLFVSACTIGNWNICGPQTPKAYCDKEAYEALMYPKPYGAHWIKDGMTRESRREDLKICGSINNEDIQFTKQEINKFRLPSDPNDINAYLRLRDRLGDCMSNLGYKPIGDLNFLGGCDERCMYP